jgi:sugar O-acyltransferase (sialic acid O-acetyltransferase NeuD family)
MKPLWIIGAGGHGCVVADAALVSGRWCAVEFFDDRWPAESEAHGCAVVGTLSSLRERLTARNGVVGDVVVAVGDNARRLSLCHEFAATGAVLATVIHPSAVLSSSATVGAGSVVLAGAVVNPKCRVGLACIINTHASIDHDCTLSDGVHVCPGATLAGSVVVHERAWIGVGSCVIQGITIGRAATVGAGAAVIRDVAAGTTVIGCPAKETASA